MKDTLFCILLVCMFFSCKKNIQEKDNKLPKVVKETLIIRSEKDSILTSSKKIDALSLKKGNLEYPQDLFNTKLIGLGIKDSTAINPYKKYWIDFNAICYSPAITFYIDTDNSKVYAVEYTIENLPLEKDEILFQLDIKKIIHEGNNYAVFFNKIEQFMTEDYNKIEYIETVFNFIKLDTVYKLEINNELPIFYSEVNRYKNFISKSYEEKFERDDCGDFDG